MNQIIYFQNLECVLKNITNFKYTNMTLVFQSWFIHVMTVWLLLWQEQEIERWIKHGLYLCELTRYRQSFLLHHSANTYTCSNRKTLDFEIQHNFCIQFRIFTCVFFGTFLNCSEFQIAHLCEQDNKIHSLNCSQDSGRKAMRRKHLESYQTSQEPKNTCFLLKVNRI